MHAKNEDGSSQWAVILDPNGAAFGLIPVVSKEQMPPSSRSLTDRSGPVGRIAWLDLTVPNAEATRDFYREVVGWSAKEYPMMDELGEYADYDMVGDDQDSLAGICHARGSNADLPPVWMIYLAVGDLAESLRRVEEDGGSVIKAVKNDDGEFVYAAIRDPVGVHFALIQST